MDCCNYVPYGQHHLAYGHHPTPPPHHQPYYGAYPDPARDYYGREYYAPPPPPTPAAYECYGGRYACPSPYYAPPPSPLHCGSWTHPSPLDDPFRNEYVYNPKEARIRKAMRDALRDRAIGASALARPGARRAAPPWLGGPQPPQAPPAHQVSPHDELIMPNPLAQLQQQTEMWSSYPDMNPRSSNGAFMMHETLPTPPHYSAHAHHHDPSLANDMQPMGPSITPHPAGLALSMPLTPPHSNENVPPEGVASATEAEHSCVGERPRVVGEEPTAVGTQPLAESGNQMPQGTEFVNVYAPERLAVADSRKAGQEGKMKKILPDQCTARTKRPPNMLYYLPLSCTNFSASPDLFTNDAEYHRKYIAKYFQGMPEYEVLNIMSEDGLNFPYATVLPRYHHSFNIRKGS